MSFLASNASSSISESLSQQLALPPTLPPLLRYEFASNACTAGIFANSGSLPKSPNLIRDPLTTSCAPGTRAIGIDVIRPSTPHFDQSSPAALLANLDSLWSIPGFQTGSQNKAINQSEVILFGEFENPGIFLNLWLDLFRNEEQQKFGWSDSTQSSSFIPVLTIGSSKNVRIPPVDLITECDRRQVDLQVSILPQGRRRYRRLQPSFEDNERTESALEIIFRTSDEYYEPCQRIVIDNFDDFLPPSRSVQVATRNPGNISRTTIEMKAQLVHLVIILADQHQQAFVNGQPSVRLQEPFDASSLSHWRTYDKSATPGTFDGNHSKESELQLFTHKRSSVLDQHPPSSLSSSSTLRLARLYQFELHQVEFPTNLEKYVLETMAHDFLSEALHEVLSGPPPPPLPNHPPQAVIESIQPFVVSEGLEELNPLNGGGVLWLSGTDNDPGDEITALEVMVPPEWGELILSVSVRRKDNIPHGTLLSDLAFLVNGTRFPVEYRFHGGKSTRGSSGHFDRQRRPQPFVVMGASSSSHNNRTNLAKDSFTFRVRDSRGQWSEPKQATMQIHSSLWALAKDYSHSYHENDMLQKMEIPFANNTPNSFPREHQVRTGSAASIFLVGMDSSGLNRSMGFYLESTMHTGLGTLSLTGNNSTILKAGDIIDSTEASTMGTATASTQIQFQASPTACDESRLDQSNPGSEIKTSFSYRVVAYDNNSGRVSSVSDLVSHNISIHCKILPIDFAFVDQGISSMSSSIIGNEEVLPPSFEVRAFHGFWDDPCSGYMFEKTIWNTSNITGVTNDDFASKMARCSSVLILNGWSIATKVTHTEKVKVSIVCQNGLLTISQGLLEGRLIRPLKDQMVMRSTLQFFVAPQHLSKALSFIHFQSSVVGNDEIQISIQYGDCSSSMDGEEDEDNPANFNNTSACDAYKCFQTTRKILIHVLEPTTTAPTDTMFKSFPWIPLPATVVLLLVIKLKGKARSILSEGTIDKEKENRGKYPKRYEEEGKKIDCDETFQEKNGSTNELKMTEGRNFDDFTYNCRNQVLCHRWKQLYDPETGFYFYLNTVDGSATWEPPVDEGFLPVTRLWTLKHALNTRHV